MFNYSSWRDNPAQWCLIAGPCVIESEALCLEVAGTLKSICERLGIAYIFKASFDKANRTSLSSFRGLGFDAGLSVLATVREACGVAVLTDVHEQTPLDEVAEVVDVLQTPALLCRQTDYLQRVAGLGKPVNLKKGQFLAPEDMVHVVNKCRAMNNEQLMVTERGVCFGYHNLVADMRALAILKQTQCPVFFDATHSVQLPGAGNGISLGQREFVPVLARAAMAAGVRGIFMETHPHPDQAKSDGPNSWPLDKMEPLLSTLCAIHEITRGGIDA